MLLDHLNFYVVIFEDHTKFLFITLYDVSLYRDRGEEFGGSIPQSASSFNMGSLAGGKYVYDQSNFYLQ